jgi:hypothetical protein
MGISHTPATPPAAADRDPRPLAQAILGKWQMGPMSMTFMPDGTMVATFMGGQQRQGHWSVGAGRQAPSPTPPDRAEPPTRGSRATR